MWRREALCWAAGLIEGEGCFTIRKRPGKNCTDLRITVGSTDEDVVRKLRIVIGFGSITYRPQPATRGNKPCWVWQVGRREHVYALCAALYPFMGLRRQARIRELLAGYLPTQGRPAHGTNARYATGCNCADCRRAHADMAKQWRERKAS